MSQFTDCPGSSCSVSNDSLESEFACCAEEEPPAAEAESEEEEEGFGWDFWGGGLMISCRSVLNLMVSAIGAAGAAGCGANWNVEGAEMIAGCSGRGGRGGGAAVVVEGRGGVKGVSV